MLAKYVGIKPSCHTGIHFHYGDTITFITPKGFTIKERYCSLGNLMIYNLGKDKSEAWWKLYMEFATKNVTCPKSSYRFEERCRGYGKQFKMYTVA